MASNSARDVLHERDSKTVTTESLSVRSELKSQGLIRLMGVDIEKPPSPKLAAHAASSGSSSSRESKREAESLDAPEESGQEREVSGKKARLTKDQSNYLEQKFQEHVTLTSGQKNKLALELGLQKRQVEVWFQNRRARTKLKRVQDECESLQQWCSSLQQENLQLRQKLQKVLVEKALAHARQQLSLRLFP